VPLGVQTITSSSVNNIKHIINTYQEAADQLVNMDKDELLFGKKSGISCHI